MAYETTSILSVISVFVTHSSLTGTLASNAHLPASACFFFALQQLAVQPHIILHLCLHLTLIACLEGIYKRKERSKEITVRNILEYLKIYPIQFSHISKSLKLQT